ncbi:hypothetical protein ACFV29_41065 [Streptomyces sp. NPDC059690]|uniref:hypothetical protein n=1 Tax=Streptomyces sp. NPDC059690 TaxID=3346907 RepID=UPI00367EA4D2
MFLLLAGVVVMFDPLLVLGDGDWNRSAANRRSRAEATAPESTPPRGGRLVGRPARTPRAPQAGSAASNGYGAPQTTPRWAPPPGRPRSDRPRP